MAVLPDAGPAAKSVGGDSCPPGAPRRFEIRTTRGRFVILAESAGRAHEIVAGRAMPYGVPEAPPIAVKSCYCESDLRGHQHAGAAWDAWWRENRPRLWAERLDWASGECLIRVIDLGPAGQPGLQPEPKRRPAEG